MIIDDPKMMVKFEKALRLSNNLYNLDDIASDLRNGRMQGHTIGNSWALTQVHDWPRRRSVNIMYVIGEVPDMLELEAKVEKWAKEVGANLMTATGREGWSVFLHDNWKKVGTLYSKDI